MRKKKKKKCNPDMLSYVPKKVPSIEWKEEEKQITIIYENNGFYDKLVQKICKKPKKSYIDLDEIGSFVWKHIDGSKNIKELGTELSEEFKEKAEPLYPRLYSYLDILYRNQWIN